MSLGVDTVAAVIADARLGIRARHPAHAILAVLARDVGDHPRTHPRLAESLRDEPFLAVGIDLDVRQAVAELRVDPLAPQAAGLVGVAVRRDHQISIGIVGARGPLPSVVSRSFDPVAILRVNLGMNLLHLRPRAAKGLKKEERSACASAGRRVV